MNANDDLAITARLEDDDLDPARVYPDGIDDDMKRGKWFVWSPDEHKGPRSPNHPHYNHSGGFNALDKATGFDKALEVAESWEMGVSYPFSNRHPDNPADPTPFVAIDLDIADEKEPEKADGAWIPDLGMLGDATVEYSPSGNLRVYLRDVEIPDWWVDLSTGDKTRPEIGLYDTEKHVTVTGDVLEGFEPPVGSCNGPAFAQWLKEAWVNYHEYILGDDIETGDEPWLDDDEATDAAHDTGSSNVAPGDLLVTDLRFVTEPVGERVAHPVHGSSNGNNFVIDDDRETFRCWRHECTGNALHLLGVDEGIIDCGDWVRGGLDSETWRDIFDAARERGYDVPEPKSSASSASSADSTPYSGGSDDADGSSRDDGWHARYSRWFVDRLTDDNAEAPSRREQRDRMASELDREYKFAARYTEGADPMNTPLYRYDPDEGYYVKDGVAFIGEEMETKLNYATDNTDAEKVAYKIRVRNLVDTDDFNPAISDDRLVNLENGVLDIDSRTLEPHSPETVFTRQIPVEYDPDAECPEILSFLDEITGRAKDARTLLQWVGFGLKPQYSPEKFLLLTGDGRNGKGVYFEILETFFGGSTSSGGNVSAVEMKTITGESRFGFSNLEGALMNIDGDVAGGSLTAERLSKLKKLTGGDYIEIEEKMQPSYEAKNRAKIAFAANEPPRFNEASDSIAERLLHVETPYKFTPHDGDGHKDLIPKTVMRERLMNDAELSGLLNEALDALEELEAKNRFAIEEGTTAEDRFERYRHESDPISAFASACLEETGDGSTHWLPKNAVYHTFENFVMANMNSKEPTAKSAFYRKLGQFIDYDEAYPKIGDSQQKVVKGLWFTEGAAEYIPAAARDGIEEMYVEHEKLSLDDCVIPAPAPNASYIDDHAVADGGEAAHAATDGTADGDEGDGPDGGEETRRDELNAIVERLEDLSRGDGLGVDRGVLCASVAKHHDIDPTRTRDLLGKLVREGRIEETPGHKYKPL